MSSCQFVLKAKVPEFIWVADKPPLLGGKVERLPIGEFQKRFQCIYNDGISIREGEKIEPFQESITNRGLAPQLKRQVEKVLKAGVENLAICKMGAFGHGVFALADIPKDKVVAIYGGTITDGKSGVTGYDLGYYGTRMIFSAQAYRGIATFMQHLPERPKTPDPALFSRMLRMTGQNISVEELKLHIDLYSTEFRSAKDREAVALENIGREYLNIRGTPVIALVTSTAIKRGKQLGFNYSWLYWRTRSVKPVFFDRGGKPLSLQVYKRTFGRLSFSDFSRTGEYGPLVESLKGGKASVVTIKDDDGRDRRVPASELTSRLLMANACQIEVDPRYRGQFAKADPQKIKEDPEYQRLFGP